MDVVSRESYRIVHEISAYSFAALARAGRPIKEGRNGALLTLTYLGAVRAIPNYNVMGPVKAALESSARYMAAELGPKGIRVHPISPGPIKTRAASGIDRFDELMEKAAERAPARALVTIEDVGVATALLATDYAKLITGDTLYIDGGYHIVG